MSAEFSVQPYQDGDEKKILEAFFTVFGKQRTLQEWEWLYRHSPQGAR
ncbi:MAG: hypothetical protein HN842_11120, partial [Gammaproteobacteria bacterium]|nr:hypothetical protein [Gammaproteobacteria bacterium]